MTTASQALQSLAPAPGEYTLQQSRFFDADDHASSLQYWNQSYQQLSAGRFEGNLEEVWFGNIQLFRECTNQIVDEGGRPWDSSRTFGVPIEIEGEGWYCGETFQRDSIITLRGGDELDFRTPRVLDVVAVTADTRALSEYAMKVEGRDIEAELGGRRMVRASAAQAAELRAFLLTALASIQATPEMLNHTPMRKALEQAIFASLLAAVAGDTETDNRAAPSQGRRKVVDAARQYMQAHIDEPISVADLCAHLGVSRRTLQYSFQHVLELNPVSYLRAMRLNGVRRALRKGDPALGSVADIAARWGFWHLSHFAADYKTMFGELPSETLRLAGLAHRPSAG